MAKAKAPPIVLICEEGGGRMMQKKGALQFFRLHYGRTGAT